MQFVVAVTKTAVVVSIRKVSGLTHWMGLPKSRSSMYPHSVSFSLISCGYASFNLFVSCKSSELSSDKLINYGSNSALSANANMIDNTNRVMRSYDIVFNLKI